MLKSLDEDDDHHACYRLATADEKFKFDTAEMRSKV